MDTPNDVQQFLTALRGRITPEKAGLTVFGGERRVPGLRRAEVAQLTGVSTAYYTRMERGDLSGVSESVLYALVRALQLGDAESAHLFDLARAATGARRQPRAKPESAVSPLVAQLLDTMRDVPAIATNRVTTIAGSNALGRAVFPDLFPADGAPVSGARYLFLDDRAKDFYLDWETSAREAVSALRLLAGQDPSDKALMALVGELATRSSDFRTWWGGHTVRVHNSGTKRIKHPVVGEMTLSYESIVVPSNAGIVVATYLAEPGTPSADALDLLRSWSAQPVDPALNGSAFN
ncbi:helix-turn-helix transcriptional regulator [Rathayibacter sp. VKM Ac-2929]|uniref:helix-turn-helix transcriptional regulator n=1 Tax=Rathayibacter sp. VKM Ac-2929 TaxID=2929480 RepID=UPI001FB27BC9|nr:helix-turn-helix transcriptional regulator [Rathayibacter sp. VKM Ac-2929]MCJ1674479.1 helix-turn-helix transcriptional regulator [Rathayibacter sp. VKM Ac-2929]